jgi:hypothetical protein
MFLKDVAEELKKGYRVRRTSWIDDQIKTYMKADSRDGELEIVSEFKGYHFEDNEMVEHRSMQGFPNITLEEVLADDWEVITAGIRKLNGRHGLEYDDDIDWDNWVPPKGGWFDGDDDL